MIIMAQLLIALMAAHVVILLAHLALMPTTAVFGIHLVGLVFIVIVMVLGLILAILLVLLAVVIVRIMQVTPVLLQLPTVALAAIRDIVLAPIW